MKVLNDMKHVILCGRKSGCCPEVFMTKDEVRIQDDYLNSIIMTKEQFQELVDKIERGEIY